MKGMSLPDFLPYTEHIIITTSVTMPQSTEISGEQGEAPEAFVRSPMAFEASERPMMATVGPMTTGGIT